LSFQLNILTVIVIESQKEIKKMTQSNRQLSEMQNRMNSLSDRLAVLESNFNRAQQLIQADMKKLIELVRDTGDSR